MADLSLNDALTDSVPDTEDVVERDFVATLEAESFDDQIGETVGKTNFVPLLDNNGKGGLSPLGSSVLTSAPWPETQGDVGSHQTDQQDFGTDFPTGSMSGFSQSSPQQMIDSSPFGVFSGFSEPSVMLNTAASPALLQTERVSEPHASPAVQVTETSKIPAEPLIAVTPKSPVDISAGVFGERWSDEAGIPSDLPFTPSVSTVISRHASHLTESPHNASDPHWSPRDSGAVDERETESSDRKKDKKKKKRRPRDDVFDTELQSESAESPHRSSPRKERDREGDWEDVTCVGGRVKKPKSRKKIPEEWAIHAEPFVPASASISQEFGSDSGLMSLSEDYTDKSFIPLSLTQDLLSFTATSPPSTLQPVVMSPKSPGQTSGLSVSSGFHEIIMETDSSFKYYTKDSSLGKAASLTPAGAFEEAMFEEDRYTPPHVMSLLESPMKEPQMSTPESTRFVPPMEALISAPPFSPSGPAWSLNNHNLSGVTPAPLPSPKNKTPKEPNEGKRSCSSSSKNPSTPDAQLPSPQSSCLNPAAPPFFPSFAEPLEPQAFTSEENCEKNKPEVNKTDNIQKSDNSDVINKTQKDEKTLAQKDTTEHTGQIQLKESPEKMKETTKPDKKEEKTDKIEKVDKIETPVKVEVMEKVDQVENPLTKVVSEKDEIPAEKKETTESSINMDNEKMKPVEKPEVKREKVKADENESNRDTAEENKRDLKLEKDKVEKQQKTDEDKVQQKTEKVESADKKSAKAEKDEKGEKAKRPAAKPTAAKPAASAAKDLSSPEKKTKPVAGATKPLSTKPRPSSASTATPAPKRPTPTSSTSAPAPLSKKAPVLKAPSPSAGTKRPATASTRPHTTATSTTASGTAAKEVKPKQTATEKRPLVPKVSTVPARPAAPKNSSSTTAENKLAITTTRTSTTTRPTASAPATRRPAVLTKTDGKPEEKKTTTLKTTDAARSKTAPLRTSTATSRISARPTKTPSTTTSSTAAADKKPPAPRPSRPNSTTASATARPAPRPGSASATDIKIVRSKIGSTDNIKHQPGGGKVTVSQNRTDTQSKDISQGKIQILNKKVDVSKVTSKCDSKANMKHKPGGGDVKIESRKMNYKAQSKIGSMDNVNHEPGGGKVKAEGVQETAEGSQAPSSGVSAAQPAVSSAQENGLKEGSAPCSSEELRDPQGLDSLIPETN